MAARPPERNAELHVGQSSVGQMIAVSIDGNEGVHLRLFCVEDMPHAPEIADAFLSHVAPDEEGTGGPDVRFLHSPQDGQHLRTASRIVADAGHADAAAFPVHRQVRVHGKDSVQMGGDHHNRRLFGTFDHGKDVARFVLHGLVAHLFNDLPDAGGLLFLVIGVCGNAGQFDLLCHRILRIFLQKGQSLLDLFGVV